MSIALSLIINSCVVRRKEGSVGQSSAGDGGTAAGPVGVRKARERAGPGKRRRVATLAIWEPSINQRGRAHMLTNIYLEDATNDVTGD